MKKRYYPRKKPFKKKSGKTFEMKAGSDRSLKGVFQQIGVPDKTAFKPDPFQQEALEAIKDSDCLVTAPTGAGKTWIAQQVAKHIMEKKGKTWYATPLKALTNSIHAQFCEIFGKKNVGILTGDIKKNPDASIIIGTTEILRNQLYDAMHTGESLNCDFIILDEAHYLGDEDRGVVWEEIMIYLPVRIPLLLLSATIGNPDQISGWLTSIRGKKCRVIENHKRPVPLFPLFFHPSGTLFPLMKKEHSPNRQLLHKKVFEFAKKKRPPLIAPPGKLPKFSDILNILNHYHLLPAIFFLKSRAECDQAIRLCNTDILSKNPEVKEKLNIKIDELVCNNPHLKDHRHRSYLENTGCASHHSGLLPAWKVVVETLMAQGLLNAMFATSTVAAGVNFPARSVVILNSDRFNGVEFQSLSPSEFQQMTGRAGRRGMDNIGFGIALPGKFMDLKYVGKLINANPLDVPSQIKIDFSMVLNLLLSHTPEQIRHLLDKSFASYLISQSKKRGELARKRFGNSLEHLWMDFLDHMGFLQQEKFVDEDGKLTSDGIWASKLRIDSPLLVAESIRQNLLPDKDAALLAAMMASFVNEKEFKDDPLYKKDSANKLTNTFIALRKGLKPFAINMLKQGFPAPNLFIQPASLMYAWAHDEPWESIMNQSEYAEGDFARLILRTAENLRQMAKLENTFPAIAQASKKAVELLLKEPVITFYN
ncbi:MAG: DEAD/DEAH box helicase [Desulfobacteraceae bacterium]|nr:DEAD/DEAH box helicase [Desulfobacteraceae bacterium]